MSDGGQRGVADGVRINRLIENIINFDGAQDAIPTTREHNSGDGGCRSCLAATVGVDGRIPIHLSGGQLKSLESATLLLQRIVDALAVGGSTPHHQARRGGRLVLPQLRAPNQFPLSVGIKTDGIAFPFPGYLNNIVRQIYLNFSARGATNLNAEVFFMIRRDGTVANFRWLQRSGSQVFDLECQGAIEAAGKAFGPLPAGFTDDVLPVRFSFDPSKIR